MEHFLAGPSGATQWTRCPASVHKPENQNSEGNLASRRGTFIHDLGDNILQGKTIPAVGDPIPSSYGLEGDVEPFMLVQAEKYAKYVEAVAERCEEAITYSEIRVNLTELYPDMFGTSDAIVFDHSRLHIHIIDLKTGAIPVEAHKNMQMMLYAIGAIRHLVTEDIISELDIPELELTLHIYQNNEILGDNTTQYTMPYSELAEFKEYIKIKLNKVFEPNPECVAGSIQCKYCNAKSNCDKFDEKIKEILERIPKGTPAEIEDLLSQKKLDELESILADKEFADLAFSAVERKMLELLEGGAKSEKFKIVKSSTRTYWNDEESAAKYMLDELKYPKKEVMSEKLLTINQLLSSLMLSDDAIEKLKSFTVKNYGYNKVVTTADRRKAVTPMINKFSENFE